MQYQVSWRLSAIAFATVLAACGGDNGNDPTPAPGAGPGTEVPAAKSGTVAGTVFKGPVNGASVCVYTVTGGAKGAKLAAQTGSLPAAADGCVLTGADGTFTFVLPAGATGDLLLESSGGTYCSNETNFNGTSCTGGTPVAMGSNVLRTVTTAPAADASVNAPLTLLTSASVEAGGTLSAGNFRSSYQTIAGNFSAPTDPSLTPSTGALNATLQRLALYVGNSTSDLGDILTGIASGTLVGGNTNFPVGVELAVGIDSKVARLFTVGDTGATLASTANLPGIPGSYARSGSTVTVTMPAHNLRNGFNIPLRFAAGTGGSATSGTYAVTVVDDDNFTITDTASGTVTGGTLYRDPVTQLTGTYMQVAGNSYITVTLPAHGLQGGDQIDLTIGSGGAASVGGYVDSVIDANTVQVGLPSAATANAEGAVTASIGATYSSYDVAMHPSGKWLYVVSGYDCGNGSPFCWGGDTITTFRIDWQRGRLTPLGAIRTGGTTSTPIPVKMAFNAAGTRMVHQDDDLDGLVLWNVNADTGALTRVADSGSSTTGNHGVVFSPDGQYVYNGAQPFSVTDSAITRQSVFLPNGNSQDIVDNVMFFTRPSSTLYAFSIATPGAPVQIASTSVSTGRDSSTRNGNVVLTSGPGGIASYIFNGSAFAAATPSTGSSILQRDGSGALENTGVMYRSVNLNQAGNLAVASYFHTPNSAGRRALQPSGYVFAQVGTDGRLTHIATSATGQYARSAKFIKQPAN